MNVIFTFFSILGLLGNVHCAKPKSSKPDTNEVIWTIKRHSKKLKKEKGISLALYGTSCAGPDKVYDGKVHRIDVMYRIDKKLKYEEARVLFYSVVDDFLAELNTNEKIRDCFYHYPVTYKDLYFILSFDYEDKGYLSRDDVSMISIYENEIMYFFAKEDGAHSGLQLNPVVPDNSKITGMTQTTGWSDTKCFRRQLPEEDISNPLETSKKQSPFRTHY